MPDVICPNCQAAVAAGRFCSSCAGPLPIGPPPARKSQAKSTALLLLGLLVGAAIFLYVATLTNFYGLNSLRSSSDATEPARPGVTLAGYNRIQDGMSYAQVVQILGKSGQEISSNNIAGFKTVMYQWDDGSFGNMNAIFQNGALTSKSQLGLK